VRVKAVVFTLTRRLLLFLLDDVVLLRADEGEEVFLLRLGRRPGVHERIYAEAGPGGLPPRARVG